MQSREGVDGRNQAVSTTHTLSPSKYSPQPRLSLGQGSRLRLSSSFNTASSAPGKSPSPVPRNTRGTILNIRHDAVSEVHRDVVNTQTMVSDIRHMLKSQEGAGSQHLSVSVTHAPSATEYTFTVFQTRSRSAISTAERSKVLRFYLVSLGNCHLRHQGPSLDATS